MAVKKKSKTKKKLSTKKIQRGTVGNFFVFGVLALLVVLGITAVGGLPSQTAPETGQVVRVINPTQGQSYSNLQLKTFGYVTLAPTPTPAKASLCNNRQVNTESEILEAYYPGQGQTTGTNGQVKVWVTDEGAPLVAPGEKINSTGKVITRGNTSAKAPDGYIWEPALYVGTPVEQGGTARYPDFIKGQFDNSSPRIGVVVKGPTPDTVPAGTKKGGSWNDYTAEYIWNVSGLGLTPGTYQAEFVIHDGDRDRGVGCVNIQIQ